MRVFLIVFLFLVNEAMAADIGCGRDTDRNGSVDNYCSTSDRDYDGVTTDQGDCDDEDWNIQPGRVTTKGCSAGQYRTCKADGSGYTSCVASASTPYCPTGDHTIKTGLTINNCYYFDNDDGNDSTGNGSYATPWKTAGKIASLTPAKGTAYIFINSTDTYDETSNYVIDFTSTAATASEPFLFLGYPTGTKPVFEGLVRFYQTDYVYMRDIEMIDSPRTSSTDVALDFYGTTDYVDIAGMYIHGAKGLQANNHACLGISGYATAPYVHHNYTADCYDDSDDGGSPDITTADGHGIYLSQTDGESRVEYNDSINTADLIEYCVYEKHLRWGSTGVIKGNYCQNAAAFLMSSGAMNRTITGNLFVRSGDWAESVHGIYLASSAGRYFFGGTTISNNTFVGARGLTMKPQWGYWEDNTTASKGDECSCTVGTDCVSSDHIPSDWDQIVFEKNIMTNTVNTFLAMWIGMYESDITYSQMEGKLQTRNNGFYSSGSPGTIQMDYFGSNNSCATYCCSSGSNGAEYNGLSAMQARSPTAFEVGSINENPSLASGTYIPSNVSMTNWGYMVPSAGQTVIRTSKSNKRHRR